MVFDDTTRITYMYARLSVLQHVIYRVGVYMYKFSTSNLVHIICIRLKDALNGICLNKKLYLIWNIIWNNYLEFGNQNLKLYKMLTAVTQWMPNWKRNGWKTSNGQTVKNKDDFIELDRDMQGIDINWVGISVCMTL